MPRRLRIALAGAGMVTRHHLIGWSRAQGAEVVAICNRSVDRARERAAEFRIPAVYGSLEEMLDHERPDALDVAVAADLHAPYALAAAERGIDVLCQKPLCLDIAEARDLVARIDGRVRFMVHENWRFRPQYRQIAAWIRDGRIGSVRQFSMAAASSGLIPTVPGELPRALVRQPFLADMKRFLVLELLIHHLDTIRALAGDLRVVAARIRRNSPLVAGEDTALILLEGDEGAIGTVSGTMTAPGMPAHTQDRLEMFGERGRIVFEGDRLVLEGSGGSETIVVDLDAAYQQAYDNTIAHFIDGVTTGLPFETEPIDNLKTLTLVDDVYAKAGRLSAPAGKGGAEPCGEGVR